MSGSGWAGAAEWHGLTLWRPFDKVAVVQSPLGNGSVLVGARKSPFARLTEVEPRMRTAGISTDLQQNARHLDTLSESALRALRRFI